MTPTSTMHPTLLQFIRQWLFVAFWALVPVLLAAALSVPNAVGDHRAAAQPGAQAAHFC